MFYKYYHDSKKFTIFLSNQIIHFFTNFLKDSSNFKKLKTLKQETECA